MGMGRRELAEHRHGVDVLLLCHVMNVSGQPSGVKHKLLKNLNSRLSKDRAVTHIWIGLIGVTCLDRLLGGLLGGY